MVQEQAVLAAAATLIAAFARNDRAAYFAAFAPEASFIFPNMRQVLTSRAAYEAAWEDWIRDDGFHVEDCTSANQAVALYGEIAVFTHQTVTDLTLTTGRQTFQERETIIFNLRGGSWVAVHEHLSALPQ